MEEPDLADWLRQWRLSTEAAPSTTPDAAGSAALEPLVVLTEDRWTVLSPSAAPRTLRVDVMLDSWLHEGLTSWLYDELLRWSFSNPYVDEALQFACAPDGTLVACTHLHLSPETDGEQLLERLSGVVDQADDAWTLLVAQTLMRAHEADLAEHHGPHPLAA